MSGEFGSVLGELEEALEQIESQLVWGDLPIAALAEFKSVVDGARTSIAAFVTARQPSNYGAALQNLRLRLATNVCRGLVDSIASGVVTDRTPGFAEFRATHREILERLEGLLGNA